jgi:hypothetical protein
MTVYDLAISFETGKLGAHSHAITIFENKRNKISILLILFLKNIK